MNKTILITGAAGFIGRKLYDKLNSMGKNLIQVDNLSEEPLLEPHQDLIIDDVEKISIITSPLFMGEILDTMYVFSEDLPQGVYIPISVIGVDGNILSGNLSGVLLSNNYIVGEAIYVQENDTLEIEAGTKFLFEEGLIMCNFFELDDFTNLPLIK